MGREELLVLVSPTLGFFVRDFGSWSTGCFFEDGDSPVVVPGFTPFFGMGVSFSLAVVLVPQFFLKSNSAAWWARVLNSSWGCGDPLAKKSSTSRPLGFVGGMGG